MRDRLPLTDTWERESLPHALRLRRTLHLSHKWKGRAIRLSMAGAEAPVSLWVDGRRASGEGDAVERVFDLTDHLYGRTEAELTVELPKDASVPTMLLLSAPSLSIVGTPLLHLCGVEENQYTVRLSCRVHSVLSARKQPRVIFSLTDGAGKRLRKAERSVVLPPYGDGEATVELTLSTLTPWEVEAPTLYTLAAQLCEGKDVLDEVETKVGVCAKKTDARRGFLQNGLPLKLKCVPFPTAISEQIPPSVPKIALSSLREIGANTLQLRHGPQTEEILLMCDRMGLGAIIDLSDREDPLPQVRRYAHHVSLLAWQITPPSESSPRADRWLSRLVWEMRREDPFHPIGLAVDATTASRDLACGDFLTAPAEVSEMLRQTHPTKPQLLVGTPDGADRLWSDALGHAYLMGLSLTASHGLSKSLAGSLSAFPLLCTRFGAPLAYEKLACLWQTKHPHLVLEIRGGEEGSDVYLYTNCDRPSLSVDGRPMLHPLRLSDRIWRYEVPAFEYLDAVAFRGGNEVCRKLYEHTYGAYALRIEPLSLPRPYREGEIAYFRLTAVDTEGRLVSSVSPEVTLTLSGDAVLDGPEEHTSHTVRAADGIAVFGIRRTHGHVAPDVVAEADGLHQATYHTHH